MCLVLRNAFSFVIRSDGRASYPRIVRLLRMRRIAAPAAIAIVCVFVPADQQCGRCVHDIVIQRFLAVQHTVDVKLHLVVSLIKRDRDVMPAAA